MAMLVIVLESAPPRLRGYLTRLFLEIRAGVYVGDFSIRIRERIWEVVKNEIGDGNAVMIWPSQNDSGYDFDSCGENRRNPVDFDGLRLCSYTPRESAKDFPNNPQSLPIKDDW
jgi:CRISPR-associated protein Cas2